MPFHRSLRRKKLWAPVPHCLFVGLTTLVIGIVPSSAQTGYQGQVEDLPSQVAPQPIPFSHKVHSNAGAECLDCHPGANKKERAGLPQPDQCMLCHAAVATDRPPIRELAALAERDGKLPWVRVYQVPDFVFFSHASHVKAGEQCSTCHAAVEKQDVLAKEVSTSMIRCMNCHQQRNVSRECHLCHDLGQ